MTGETMQELDKPGTDLSEGYEFVIKFGHVSTEPSRISTRRCQIENVRAILSSPSSSTRQLTLRFITMLFCRPEMRISSL